ncbi:hypothetical protein QYE76_019694 [Lolium multiflorum]|uniref:Uncharacterized protein n=1 Tax=Lolium multiflorum TaxID=4521 RepID=A0AAD8VNE2_LOLMU|nr:hypothetical protein QYE76_019694 [Lolium multiflorum]
MVVLLDQDKAYEIHDDLGFHRIIGSSYSRLGLALAHGDHQVNGYSNNSYRGYATLEEAQQEYLNFLEEELLEDQAIDEAVPLAQLPPEEVHALQGAPPEVRPSRVKDYIIAFLIVVIVRILFF